jgi:hypothetical protein
MSLISTVTPSSTQILRIAECTYQYDRFIYIEVQKWGFCSDVIQEKQSSHYRPIDVLSSFMADIEFYGRYNIKVH